MILNTDYFTRNSFDKSFAHWLHGLVARVFILIYRIFNNFKFVKMDILTGIFFSIIFYSLLNKYFFVVKYLL